MNHFQDKTGDRESKTSSNSDEGLSSRVHAYLYESSCYKEDVQERFRGNKSLARKRSGSSSK